MKRYEQYFKVINSIGSEILSKESRVIETVAKAMAVALKNQKQLFLFGCGHSHILVEEAFYRAGGLVPVTPIFDTALMLHDGAVYNDILERTGASSATISRVNRSLNYGTGAYSQVFARLKDK